MLKYGLRNVRRLEFVEPLEIKPITLLVGRNSGGKSTFLRTFPLFRQSIMTRTSSPLLWYGDLVDFGSFDTAISRDCDPQEIGFTYVLDSLHVDDRPVLYDATYGYIHHRGNSYEIKEASYSAYIIKRNDRNRLSRVELTLTKPDASISIEIDDNNFISRLSVNGDDVLKFINPTRMSVAGGALFPDVRFNRQRDDERRNFWASSSSVAVMPYLHRLLRKLIDRRIKDTTINSIAARLISIGFPTPEAVLATSQTFGKTASQVFSELLRNPKGKSYQELFGLLSVAEVPNIARSVSSKLSQILSSSLYIGPARARSERYYRYQDLSISEIDPDGKNFPMFLNSLSKRNKDAFSEWVQRLFGYGVAISQQSGHISITLTDGAVQTNIVDVGYGVSQILPVLGQIWWARERPRTRDNRSPFSLLAIEQPELHLHPAHQALLADALVDEVNLSRAPSGRMHYLVETHSETLVNRLGEFIALGKIPASDVQIVLFEPHETEGWTRARPVEFDDQGVLVDWPFGFFQAPSVPA